MLDGEDKGKKKENEKYVSGEEKEVVMKDHQHPQARSSTECKKLQGGTTFPSIGGHRAL